MAVNVKKITAAGPGHALLELDGDPGFDRLEIAVLDFSRDEYLGPSTPDKTTWLKRPHYFTASRVEGAGGFVFRIGPEICNYVPAAAMVEISSRDGTIASTSPIAWADIVLLDLKRPLPAWDDDNRRRHSPEPKPKPDEKNEPGDRRKEASGSDTETSAGSGNANDAGKNSGDTSLPEDMERSTDEAVKVDPGPTSSAGESQVDSGSRSLTEELEASRMMVVPQAIGSDPIAEPDADKKENEPLKESEPLLDKKPDPNPPRRWLLPTVCACLITILAVAIYSFLRPGRLEMEYLSVIEFTGPQGGPFAPEYSSPIGIRAEGRGFHWSVSVQGRGTDWLTVSPTQGELGRNGSTQVTLGLAASASAKAPGTYDGYLAFKDPSGSESVQYVRLVVKQPQPVVNPQPGHLKADPPEVITFTGPPGGPFDRDHLSVRLSAEGGDVHWSAQGLPIWLTISPAEGDIRKNDSATVVITLLPAAQAKAPGTYETDLVFNTSSRATIARTVRLVVKGPPPTSKTTLSPPDNGQSGWNIPRSLITHKGKFSDLVHPDSQWASKYYIYVQFKSSASRNDVLKFLQRYNATLVSDPDVEGYYGILTDWVEIDRVKQEAIISDASVFR